MALNQVFCFQTKSHFYSAFGLIILLLCSFAHSHNVIITEIYRDPPGAETALGGGGSHEFVEITNLGCDTFSLNGLLITDGADSDSLVVWGNVITAHQDCHFSQNFLHPGQTALILDSDYQTAIDENYAAPLPIANGTVLLRVDDKDIGNSLASDDGIAIYRGTKKNITEIIASLSDEPLNLTAPVSGKISLSSPKNREGLSVTPGMFLFNSTSVSYVLNAISPGAFDELKNGFIVQHQFSSVNNDNPNNLPCSLICLRINCGSNEPVSWVLKSVLGTESNVINSGSMSFVNQKHALALNIPLSNGNYYLTLDTTSWHIDISSVYTPVSSIAISEIFPKAISLEPEWIELYNRSQGRINLNGWKLGNSEDTIVIIDRNFYIEPDQHLVITKQSKTLIARYPGLTPVIEPPVWHTLNNTQDTIMLLNPQSVLVDIVCYNKKWFSSWSSGSLERTVFDKSEYDSLLWTPSFRASPAMPNGSQLNETANKPLFEIGPIPFTPNNDGKDDHLLISLKLPPSHTLVSLSIFSFNGRCVYNVNEIQQGEFLWDGKERNGKPVINGPIFVVAELNSSKGTTKLMKKSVLWR